MKSARHAKVQKPPKAGYVLLQADIKIPDARISPVATGLAQKLTQWNLRWTKKSKDWTKMINSDIQGKIFNEWVSIDKTKQNFQILKFTQKANFNWINGHLTNNSSPGTYRKNIKAQHSQASNWVSSFTSHLTHKLFQRRIFTGNHLHWNWQQKLAKLMITNINQLTTDNDW